MEQKGRIEVTRKALEQERLNVDEIDFAIRYLFQKEIIFNYKRDLLMEEHYDGFICEADDDYYHRFSVNKTNLDNFLREASLGNDEGSSSFDEKTSTINVGMHTVQIPPFKNEYYFCKLVFSRPLKHLIDWEEIYQAMTGSEDGYVSQKAKRKVYDTLRSLNSKFRMGSNEKLEELFHWTANTIRREY